MKPRHHLYLDDELTDRLAALARKPGSSKSAIVAAALRSYLARGSTTDADATAVKIRLDKFARVLGRLERDQQIVLETLALLVRFQVTVTAPLAEADQVAARAQGEARFQSFVEQVGRRIATGRSLTRDVLARVAVDGVAETDPAAPEDRR